MTSAGANNSLIYCQLLSLGDNDPGSSMSSLSIIFTPLYTYILYTYYHWLERNERAKLISQESLDISANEQVSQVSNFFETISINAHAPQRWCGRLSIIV
jgi:hypothetical protein